MTADSRSKTDVVQRPTTFWALFALLRRGILCDTCPRLNVMLRNVGVRKQCRKPLNECTAHFRKIHDVIHSGHSSSDDSEEVRKTRFGCHHPRREPHRKFNTARKPKRSEQRKDVTASNQQIMPETQPVRNAVSHTCTLMHPAKNADMREIPQTRRGAEGPPILNILFLAL